MDCTKFINPYELAQRAAIHKLIINKEEVAASGEAGLGPDFQSIFDNAQGNITKIYREILFALDFEKLGHFLLAPLDRDWETKFHDKF